MAGDRTIGIDLRATDNITPVLVKMNAQLDQLVKNSTSANKGVQETMKKVKRETEGATTAAATLGDKIKGSMASGGTAITGVTSKIQGMVAGLAAATAAAAGLMKMYMSFSEGKILAGAVAEQGDLNKRWRTTGKEVQTFLDGYTKASYTTVGAMAKITESVFTLGQTLGFTGKQSMQTSDAIGKIVATKSVQLGGMSGEDFAKKFLQPDVIVGAVDTQFRLATSEAKKLMPGYEAAIKTAQGRADIMRFQGGKADMSQVTPWLKVSIEVEKVGVAIGKIVSGPLSEVLETVAWVLDAIANNRIASFGAAFAIVAGIVGGIVLAIGWLPILIAAAIAGVIYLEKKTQILSKTWAVMKDSAASLYDILKQAVSGELVLSLFGKKGTLIENVLLSIEEILDKIKGFFGWLIDGIKAIPDKLAKAMNGLMDPIRSALSLKTSAQVAAAEGKDSGWMINKSSGVMYPKALNRNWDGYVPLPTDSLANKQRLAGARMADPEALKDLKTKQAAAKTMYAPGSTMAMLDTAQINTMPGWTAPEDRAPQNLKMPEKSIFEGTFLEPAHNALKSLENGVASVSNKYLGTNLASHASGTPFVAEDMVSLIHKGERIVPASQNRAGQGGGNSLYAPVTINVASIASNVDLARVKRDFEDIMDKKLAAIRRGY